ncbi:MAG: SAM-dependent methyltransferase, partial [Tannerella sp.]|nr:SAM-dependent methyltransferase [Tannerella sp.]
MKMFTALENKYTKEQKRALDAQRLAHEIAFAPVTFQVSRLMVKFGVLKMLADAKEGLTIDEIAAKSGLKRYAVQVLIESSLTIGTVLYENERFVISKAGWFLISDPLVSVNIDFNHEVSYLGMHRMEEALLNGKPEGLKVFGEWPTIYEGLSQLPDAARKSWFGFDHFYSDNSFDEALEIVFSYRPRTLLDVGGNTGRWAQRCVDYNEDVRVTILDLPQQIALMNLQIEGSRNAGRIFGLGADLLDAKTPFP